MAPAALKGLRELVAAHPASAEPCLALAQALAQSGEANEALASLEEALARQPGQSKTLVRAGALFAELGQTERALSLFREAVRLSPDDVEAGVNLAEALRRSGERAEGRRVAEELFQANPGHERLILNLHAYRREADYEAALRFAIEKGRELEKPRCLRNAANDALYSDQIAASELADLHQELGRRFEANIAPTRRFKTKAELGRPIRLGILSSDLRRHSVAYFLLGWLGRLDPARVQLSFYLPFGQPDDFTQRFEALGPVRALGAMDARSVASAIYEDGVDVLWELNGLTEGGHLSLLAMKPAPVVVTGIGYPYSTGLTRVDYRWVDALTDPEGSSEWMSETPLRVEPPFLCYHPVDDLPPVSPRPDGAPLTFGSFNNSVKITRACVAQWAEALRQTPESELLVKPGNRPTPEALDRLNRWFAEEGVQSRVRFAEPTASVREHLAQYGQVDIALDTWPYNGTTTTLEALLMGVPVVASWGDSHRARVSAALLSVLGKEEWIAPNPSATPQVAARLAANLDELRQNRQALRDQTLGSPLCDGEAFAAKVTRAIERVWQSHVQKMAGPAG